jgi:hypothetical protein
MLPTDLDRALKLALRERVITHMRKYQSTTIVHFHESVSDKNKRTLQTYLSVRYNYTTSLSALGDKMYIYH